MGNTPRVTKNTSNEIKISFEVLNSNQVHTGASNPCAPKFFILKFGGIKNYPYICRKIELICLQYS